MTALKLSRPRYVVLTGLAPRHPGLRPRMTYREVPVEQATAALAKNWLAHIDPERPPSPEVVERVRRLEQNGLSSTVT